MTSGSRYLMPAKLKFLYPKVYLQFHNFTFQPKTWLLDVCLYSLPQYNMIGSNVSWLLWENVSTLLAIWVNLLGQLQWNCKTHMWLQFLTVKIFAYQFHLSSEKLGLGTGWPWPYLTWTSKTWFYKSDLKPDLKICMNISG